MAVKFINMTEQDFLQEKLIFKNCSLEYCLDIISKNRLWFANPEKWHDPFESMFLRANYRLNTGTISKHPWNQRVFATCMTQTATCEAYWNIYSQQQIGMSLAIRREVLLNELKAYCRTTNSTIYIGKVEYQRTSMIIGDLRNNPFIHAFLSNTGIRREEAKVRLLLLKRSSFKYENEIRFFIVKKKKMKVEGQHIPYNCHPDDLIATITIDPDVKDNVYKMIKEKLIQYNFNNRVRRSLLYTPPKPKVFRL